MRSILYFALLAVSMANACTGTIKNVHFDLSPLRKEDQDYVTILYPYQDNLNRTYSVGLFSYDVVFTTISVVTRSTFLRTLKVATSA